LNLSTWLRRAARHPLVVTSFALAAVGGGFALRERTAPSACEHGEHATCALPGSTVAHEAPAAAIPSGPAVLEFTSEYCPACRKLAPVLEDARRQCLKAGVPVVHLDVESPSGSTFATTWQVTATPTVVFLDANHEELTRLVGARPLADVRHVIENAYGLECAQLAPGEATPG
jgi:thiol-disulfide isomerase/thioredoxin